MDAERLRHWPIAPVHRRFERRDTILYALGVGLGQDPGDESQLRFVDEQGLQALPSFSTVLAYPFLWYAEAGTGIALLNVVHAELGFENLARLPVEGAVVGRTRVTAVEDKGARVGALLSTVCEVSDEASGAPISRITSSSLARLHGGFDPAGPVSRPAEPWPQRPADATCEIAVPAQAALIFRLSGDLNRLHVDRATARLAGFDRPLLHGRCTFGVAAWALVRLCCPRAPERLTGMRARLSGPVFPGETIRTELWREAGRLRFRARVPEREATVLSHGEATLRSHGEANLGDFA